MRVCLNPRWRNNKARVPDAEGESRAYDEPEAAVSWQSLAGPYSFDLPQKKELNLQSKLIAGTNP